ncbi:MAG: hypothetical protein R3F34_20395 [Planctomycetota bacterium]
MVHERERLPLRLEALDHLARVHPELDDLERDLALHRHLLRRAPHRAHAASPEGSTNV